MRNSKIQEADTIRQDYILFQQTFHWEQKQVATPDGRYAWTPVADGVSPTAGRDVNGPTAAANSVAKLDHYIPSNGTLFNQKFHPTALEGKHGLETFVAYIRGYFDQKGSHMQFNVVSRETLIDAQKNPENYKNLVVRVAGYSALFTTLSKSLQDDIINRTEQGIIDLWRNKMMTKDYLGVKGRIFDIQKFSIHDGPGIRTIVFLKGCIFRCKWCCNPESQKYEIETMIVDGKPKIIGRDVTVEEVIEEVKKDLPYYRRSSGGVTLSGGEALLQPDFGAALLEGLNDNGIHTAMESTANAEFSVIERYLKNLDMYLLDIKHMDSVKHKKFTSGSNERVLENARKIAVSNTELIIRVPVVPGFNDTINEINDIAKFAKTLPGVKEMHLLPYHRLGQDKYAGLNRVYELEGIEPPPSEKMQKLLETVNANGLQGQIGG